MATTGKFDLNMEEVLEAWDPADGVREIIANALDEQALTDTESPEIYEDDDGKWHIRDYGRGLEYDHLTQAEDTEKLSNPDQVIGKFGVGLKDALATFHRHGIDVTIHSQHNTFTIEEAPKHGFEEISTLHVDIQSPKREIEGTEVVLDGVSDETIEQAKNYFIRYTDLDLLEETRFGEVYRVPDDEPAGVFVTGLQVAEEEEFLFSYNITNTTKKIRDALNRERSNVGRTAYTSRIKRILKACESEDVAKRLVDDLQRFTEGETHDELGWKPIQVHAVRILNAERDVVVSTVDEQHTHRDLLDTAKGDGYEVVTVPDRVRNEIIDTEDVEGNEIRDLNVYQDEYEDSFEFDFIEESDLSESEREIWNLRHDVFEIVEPPTRYEFKIASSLRATDHRETKAVHEASEELVVLKRDVLTTEEDFIGALMHMIAHIRSPFPVQTRGFEEELADLLGIVGSTAVGE